MIKSPSTFLFRASIILIVLALFFLPELTFAQGDLSQVQNEVQKNVTTGKSIIKLIIDAIFALGVIGLIYAFVSKDDRAKAWLISYVVGVIVWYIARSLFFN